MKKLKGLKIYTFLSLGIHLIFLFLFTFLFSDLDLTPSSPYSPPPEVFLSKVVSRPQPKTVPIQKASLKQEPPDPPQSKENPIHPVPFKPEPSQFLIIEEKTYGISSKEPFDPMGEIYLPIEDHLTSENTIPLKINSEAENNPIGEKSIRIEERTGKVENTEEEKKPEVHTSQFPSSEIHFDSLKGNTFAKKEIDLIYPRYVENPKPIYPREARKKGYEGEVILRVEVLTNGRVGEIEIRRSSGYEILDRSAIETIKRWRFTPAQKGEERVPFRVNIPIKFQLQ